MRQDWHIAGARGVASIASAGRIRIKTACADEPRPLAEEGDLKLAVRNSPRWDADPTERAAA